MPMSIRRTRLRAAELIEELEVADNWRVTAAERALHFSLEWDAPTRPSAQRNRG